MVHEALEFRKGISITKNPITGKLEGVPEKWALNHDFDNPIDFEKLIDSKILPKELQPNEELPDRIKKMLSEPKTTDN